jgi:hypothetical protein
MLSNSIQQKIEELFNATPIHIGVGYGKKITNGEYTGEIGIVFHVKEKLPLDQIPADQVLPTTVDIEGTSYKTDVIEVGEVNFLVCNSDTANNCYGWQQTAPANRNTIRPLQSGVSFTSGNQQATVGTLGLIAVDVATQALVGITNNHVAIENAFYTNQRPAASATSNELYDPVFQTGDIQPSASNLMIGRVIRYVPLVTSGFNYLDIAVCSIEDPSTISNTESFKQYGLDYNTPMPFATTSEINSLLSTDPEIYSSGRTTGAKGPGFCSLVVSGVGVASNVGPYIYSGGLSTGILFGDLISFTRVDPDCPQPIAGGDSGSALIANFSGVWKIIGLVFAGSTSIGYACRIDRLATEMGIEAWDGTAKNYIDPTSVQYKTVAGGSGATSITCGADKYWQIGSTNVIDSPCV